MSWRVLSFKLTAQSLNCLQVLRHLEHAQNDVGKLILGIAFLPPKRLMVRQICHIGLGG